MPMFKVRAWTGPCSVREIAGACREAGLGEVVEGTEHVIVTKVEAQDGAGACWNALASLFRTHGKDYGLKFKLY